MIYIKYSLSENKKQKPNSKAGEKIFLWKKEKNQLQNQFNQNQVIFIMNLYKPTEIEVQLLRNSTETKRLTLLQKKSFSRLQIVSYHKHICIKSLDDSFQNLRLLLAAILMKIYSQKSAQNEIRLNQLKNLIYSSKFEHLSKQKGLEKKKLLKCVAEKLTSVEVGKNAQKQIMKMFNCVPFFDETLIWAFEENNKQIATGNYSELKEWASKQLKLQIVQGNFHVEDENEEELFLIYEGEQLYKPSNYEAQMDEPESDLLSPPKTEKLLQTISVVDDSKSPYLPKKARKRQREQKYSNVEPFQIKHKDLFQNFETPSKKKKSRKVRSRETNIWSYFCCGLTD